MRQVLRTGAVAAAVTSGVVVASLSAALPASASPRSDGPPTVTVVASLDRLPTIPMAFGGTTIDAQAVPTSLAVGPDGALYVGQLPGFPDLPGTSHIYRIVPGHAPTVVASGLTAVTAIAFDQQGRLLATEYNTGGLLAPATTPGALVRVNISTGAVTTLPVSGLSQPTGLAIGFGDTVYVSNNGNSTGTREVLRITGLG